MKKSENRKVLSREYLKNVMGNGMNITVKECSYECCPPAGIPRCPTLSACPAVVCPQ
ncbi:hypothetical protein [Chryseobacterium sp. SIMBA_029]|uniref:hypothetical protein n=1 Tax=Chryseobacterium sp. SIMBA_029 TaxID=3085772 RepID=UPI0039781208